MPLVWTLLTLAVAVLIAPAACARLGRAAGWPLAGLYLISTAALWPAVTAVMKGENPTWRASWVPALGVDIALRADGLGIIFALIALLIGAVVFAYSTRYLGSGPQTSFYLVMTMFTLAMLGLVLADNLIWFFLCWELTSIASFLLIARSGHAGEQASMRTLFITFTGGLSLLIAIALIAQRTRTGSLSAALSHTVWHDDPAFAATVATLVAIAGFTKSAQFPFHIWLPDAMAAITPVSAYLHAAAVVKAGIFLLLRFTPAFHHVPIWNILLIGVGLVTAALGAWFALQQTDLKKLMAYSTVSQLGLLVATIGVGTAAAITAAVLHTIAHALFKSGLFMMVGVIDHATHTRDLRRLPQLYRAMPVSFTVTALGCASMAGIPPMLGFASKESLLTGLLSAPGPSWAGPVAMGAAVASSVLTFAYCTKIVFGGFVDGQGDRPIEPVEKSLLLPASLPILVGLPLGAAVGLLDLPVSRAAEAALPGAGSSVHLSLWHGVTAELGATLVIFALGGAVVATRRSLWPRLEHPSLPWDGPAAISALTRGLTRLGETWVRPLAVDYPSRHVALLLAAFVAVTLPALTAATGAVGLPPTPAGSTRPVDVLLAGLVTAAVIGVCRATSRLAAVVSLSAVGALCTVQILALGAPDVTLTQLLVETLTVVMMMLVLQKLPLNFGEHPPRQRRVAVVLALGVGLAAGAATFVLNGRREHGDVASYFQRETLDLSGGANIVNVILVEFRALDTLGELSVLGMAGVVLVAVLSTVRDRHLDPDLADRPSRKAGQDAAQPQLRAPGTTAHRAITEAWSNVLPMQLMLRLVTPLLVLLSLLIFMRGHNEPGGGFIAALVGSATIGLAYLSTSRDRQLGRPRLPLRLIGGGILVAVATGVWGLVVEGSFLDPIVGHLGSAHLTTSMLFDVGVYAAVLGLVMVAFNLLGTSAASTDHAGGEDTRERVDEAVEGELSGPLDTVRGEAAPSGRRVGVGTDHLATGRQPKEVGR